MEQLQHTADLIAGLPIFKTIQRVGKVLGILQIRGLYPDVQDLTKDLYEEHGYESFIYCPVGFVAEHLEVLYDNDYECKVVTDELNAKYFRPNMPNAQSAFIDCLAEIVSKK